MTWNHEITGTGFHRKHFIFLENGDLYSDLEGDGECSTIVAVNFPPNCYLDYFQVEIEQPFSSDIKYRISQKTDIEAPMSDSLEGQILELTFPLTKSRKIEIPFHIRYGVPQLESSSVSSFEFISPTYNISCPNQPILHGSIAAKSTTISIPVGNIADLHSVRVWTLLSSSIFCIFIVLLSFVFSRVRPSSSKDRSTKKSK